MSYDRMKRCWDAIRDANVESLGTTLRGVSSDLGLSGTPGTALLQGDGEPHALLAVANDYAADMVLWLIPVSAIDDRLQEALALIDGRTFAGGADLTGEQWDAAVLVMAALAYECASPTELASWAEADESSVTLEDIERYWKRWAAHGISAWSELERHVTALHTFRRAM